MQVACDSSQMIRMQVSFELRTFLNFLSSYFLRFNTNTINNQEHFLRQSLSRISKTFFLLQKYPFSFSQKMGGLFHFYSAYLDI